MNIIAMSDLHLEFHRDGGRGFIKDLDPSAVDVLVLAGDINSAEHLPETLSAICAKYPQVVLVPGNHEFYGLNPGRVPNCILQKYPPANLHWLERGTVTLNGIRFVGTTLWFPEPPPLTFKNAYNDFNWISGFEPWVYEQHKASIEFLDKTLRADDVLVTHFLPLRESIAPEHKGSSLNCFFWAGEAADKVVRDRAPRLAIHGHTHTSIDTLVGNTHVVCNPFGYATFDQNPLFDPHKMLCLQA